VSQSRPQSAECSEGSLDAIKSSRRMVIGAARATSHSSYTREISCVSRRRHREQKILVREQRTLHADVKLAIL
jgi:hypothetical protein